MINVKAYTKKIHLNHLIRSKAKIVGIRYNGTVAEAIFRLNAHMYQSSYSHRGLPFRVGRSPSHLREYLSPSLSRPPLRINSLEDERIIREAIHNEIFTSRLYKGMSRSVKFKLLREANTLIVQASELGMKSNPNWAWVGTLNEIKTPTVTLDTPTEASLAKFNARLAGIEDHLSEISSSQGDLASRQAVTQKLLEDFRESTEKRFEEIDQQLDDGRDQATWFFAISVGIGIGTAIIASEEGRNMLRDARDTLFKYNVPTLHEVPKGPRHTLPKARVLEILNAEVKPRLKEDFSLAGKKDSIADGKVREHWRRPTAIFDQPQKYTLPPVRRSVDMAIQAQMESPAPNVYQRPRDADRLASSPLCPWTKRCYSPY
jgi:hypothetical protein